MSWKDRLQEIPYTIVTGDGKEWFPQFTKSIVELTFNTRDFLYVDERGTYVKRKEAQGESFPIEFLFEGDDHVETFLAFKESSKDNRSWTLKSPYFDDIIVQPISLRFENVYNITTVTGQVKETLPVQLPEDQLDLTNDIEESIVAVNNNVISSVQPSSVANTKTSINAIETNYNSLPNTNEQVTALKDKVRECVNFATSVLEKPVQFNDSVKALIRFPLDVENETKTSLLNCQNAINDLVLLASTDPGLFDLHSTVLLTSSMELAIKGNYNTRQEVVDSQNILVSMYETQRDAFESNVYEPNNIAGFDLSVILAKTLGRLNEIAFNAKQERSIIAEYDASPIIFCHRFYGTSDKNLERFIRENNLTLDEHIQIKQGRELVYYV